MIRCARTLSEARKILSALRTLRVDDDEITIRAWGDWLSKTEGHLFFRGRARPVVESIGRKWCAIRRDGYPLIDARPLNDEANRGNIEIEWSGV